jgi:glycosyltransferase involved in cell wall biosynthesis
VFLGTLSGESLAAAYRSADVFVFPSRTDTFGLVMIEALACGTPVAAYDVGGPRDIVTPDSGSLSDDLGAAVQAALTKSRASCMARAQDFTWNGAARQFVAALVPMGAPSTEWQQRAWLPRAA